MYWHWNSRSLLQAHFHLFRFARQFTQCVASMCQWLSNWNTHISTHPHTPNAKWRFLTNMKPHRCRKTLAPIQFPHWPADDRKRERERKSKGSKRNMSKHHFVHYHTTPNPVSSRTEPYATSHFSVSFNCYIVFHLDATHNWCSKTKSTSLMSKIETCRLKRFFSHSFFVAFLFVCVCAAIELRTQLESSSLMENSFVLFELKLRHNCQVINNCGCAFSSFKM